MIVASDERMRRNVIAGDREELRERNREDRARVASAASRIAVPVADAQLSVNTAASARAFR